MNKERKDIRARIEDMVKDGNWMVFHSDPEYVYLQDLITFIDLHSNKFKVETTRKTYDRFFGLTSDVEQELERKSGYSGEAHLFALCSGDKLDSDSWELLRKKWELLKEKFEKAKMEYYSDHPELVDHRVILKTTIADGKHSINICADLPNGPLDRKATMFPFIEVSVNYGEDCLISYSFDYNPRRTLIMSELNDEFRNVLDAFFPGMMLDK